MCWSGPPSLVDRIVRAGDNGPLRAEEMVLPQSWELALSFLRGLSDNERYGFCARWTGTRGELSLLLVPIAPIALMPGSLCFEMLLPREALGFQRRSFQLNRCYSSSRRLRMYRILTFFMLTTSSVPPLSVGMIVRRQQRREIERGQEKDRPPFAMAWRVRNSFGCGSSRSGRRDGLSRTPPVRWGAHLPSGAIQTPHSLAIGACTKRCQRRFFCRNPM